MTIEDLFNAANICIYSHICTNIQTHKTFQESAYDVTIEDLFNATVKLEEKEKVYSNAEGEVNTVKQFLTALDHVLVSS